MMSPTPLDHANDDQVSNPGEQVKLPDSEPPTPLEGSLATHADTRDSAPFSVANAAESLAWEAITGANQSDPSKQTLSSPDRNRPDVRHHLTLITNIVGRAVGDYHVIARLEETTLITRYRATVADDPPNVVTLELFPFTTRDDKPLDRFQVTPASQFATRGHPNIPALIKTGKTTDGQPYLVVAPVNGIPIDAYCDSHNLNTHERLKLFTFVCDVIDVAHRHAVIHGDLKPINIVMVSAGEPMIMGFGVVDLYRTSSDLRNLALHLSLMSKTAVHAPKLDLNCTSPEQMTDGPISTAVDVYALGVILYQLLTGHSPYRLKSSSQTEIAQAIIQQIPEKPSRIFAQTSIQPEISLEVIAACRGISVARLGQMLSGDLDAIVLKTLRKEPELRYTSVHKLAEDIRAFLRGLPVDALRHSRTYRFTKFVRRHGVVLTLAALILLAILIVLVVKNAALNSARQQRDQANLPSIMSRQTVDQLYSHTTENRLLDQFNLRPLRKLLLKDAQRFYQVILDQPTAHLAQPSELAEAATRLAKLTMIIDSPAEAVPQFNHARSLWEQLIAQDPTNQQYKQTLAELLSDFATAVTPIEPKRNQARQLLQQAEKITDALLVANPESIAVRRQQASILVAQALIQDQERHLDNAIVSITNALAIYNQLEKTDPDPLETQLPIANAHAFAGYILASQPAEQFEAIAAYKRAIETRQRILMHHPDFDEQSYRLALDHTSLANCFQRTGQTDLALQAFRRSLELLDRLQDRYPDSRLFQLGKATALNVIADALRQRNEIVEALTMTRNAQAGLLRLHMKYRQDATVRIHLAKSYNIMGRLLERTGNKAEAIHAFQQAIDHYEIMMPDLDPPNIYELACNIALCLPLISQFPTRAASALNTQSLNRRRSFYTKRAIEVLRIAARAGFLNADMLDSNNDLDPLRHEPSFQQLIKDLQNQPNPRTR